MTRLDRNLARWYHTPMCWNYSEVAKKKDLVRNLPAEQRESLTWEEAGKYVAFDTILCAYWEAIENHKGVTPYQGLCDLYNIEEPAASAG